MLARAFAAQMPARWVVADTVYGTDEFRRWLEAPGAAYILAVPYTYSVWTEGIQVSAQTLMADQPEATWIRLSAGEGSQGPRYYDWTWLQLPYPNQTGVTRWLE